MPNIAQVLKEEIGRLSRKEARKLVRPLQGRIAGYSKVVTLQKRVLARLERKLARLEKQLGEKAPPGISAPPEAVKKARVSPRLIKSQRKRLSLNQDQFARLLGVSVAAVRSWEQGRSAPRGQNLTAFVGVRRMKKSAAYDRLGIKPTRKKRVRRKKKVRKAASPAKKTPKKKPPKKKVSRKPAQKKK